MSTKVEVVWSSRCNHGYDCGRFCTRKEVFVERIVCSCGEVVDEPEDTEDLRCSCGVDLEAAVEKSHIDPYLTEPWDIF